MGKIGGIMCFSGKVKSSTPKTEKKSRKKKKLTGRAKIRKTHNKRIGLRVSSIYFRLKPISQLPNRKAKSEPWDLEDPIFPIFIRKSNPPSGRVVQGRYRPNRKYKMESEKELKFCRSHHQTKKAV